MENLSRCLSWFALGLLVHFSSWFFHLGKCYVMSIISITHVVLFSKQEVLRRWAARGSSSESECSWDDGKKKQLQVKLLVNILCSKWRIHSYFKNSEKERTQALTYTYLLKLLQCFIYFLRLTFKSSFFVLFCFDFCSCFPFHLFLLSTTAISLFSSDGPKWN